MRTEQIQYTCVFLSQQPHVLAELAEYIDTKPEDGPSASLVVKYLQALNNLFENGFLSHEKIESADCLLLQRMETGYKFFVQWLDSALDKGILVYEFTICCNSSPDRHYELLSLILIFIVYYRACTYQPIPEVLSCMAGKLGCNWCAHYSS